MQGETVPWLDATCHDRGTDERLVCLFVHRLIEIRLDIRCNEMNLVAQFGDRFGQTVFRIAHFLGEPIGNKNDPHGVLQSPAKRTVQSNPHSNRFGPQPPQELHWLEIFMLRERIPIKRQSLFVPSNILHY
jgi:hypothetical protein